MKNVYLTIAFMISILFVSAQTQDFKEGRGIPVSKAQQALIKASLKQQNNSKSTSQWYDYASAAEAYYGVKSTMAKTYLFPDGNISCYYGDETGTPWVHSIATIINPTIEYFKVDDVNLVTKDKAYSVDSVSIYTRYSRGTELSIVDTLRFQFFTSNTPLKSYFFDGNTDKYGVDTTYFDGIIRDDLTINLDMPDVIIVDYLLHKSDTSNRINGFNIIKVAVDNLDINAGEVVGVSATFIPGYSYGKKDILNDLNYMTFYSYEEKGKNTFPSYLEDSRNISYVVTDQAMEAGGWSKDFLPSLAYAASWAYENHLIQMLITVAADASIESTTNNNLTVGQNSPNPFNGNTIISYNLEKTSNVNVTVYNVAGAKVMEINQGRQVAGSHNLSIDGSSLQAGVYFYTFTANNNSVTKKMIVY